VQDASVADIARILRPQGEFRFVTDWPDYAQWTLERLIRSPHFGWTAERADDWRQPWPGFHATRYEAKAKRAGRAPCYLVSAAPAEPDAKNSLETKRAGTGQPALRRADNSLYSVRPLMDIS